jgi:hypothetical protein
MPDVSIGISGLVGNLLAGVPNFMRLTEDKIQNYSDAIAAVEEAAVMTTFFLNNDSPEQGGQAEVSKGKVISLWRAAASAVSRYDYELSQNCMIKALGYGDDSKWDMAKDNPQGIQLDVILAKCWYLRQQIDR